MNEFQIIHGLTRKRLDIPVDTIERYPALEEIAAPRCPSGFLFLTQAGQVSQLAGRWLKRRSWKAMTFDRNLGIRPFLGAAKGRL